MGVSTLVAAHSALGVMIGLFIGAVILALGYQIFMEWVEEDENLGESAENAMTTD